MDVSHILDELNDAQRAAVTSDDQHLLVLAGAGSGKTRVLVHRVAWQIQAQGFLDSQLQKLKGDQTMEQISGQGAVDISKIGAQGNVEQKLQDTKGAQAKEQIKAQGDVDISKIGAQGNVDLSKIGAQGSIDTALQKLKGDQDLANITKQGDIDISKIGATGAEERKSQDNAQKNTMKDRKDQSNYARGLANMF